jgi:hypothetical protein
MKKIKGIFRLIVTFLLVGGWALAASALHVVWTGDNKPVVIPKERLGVEDTYVNVKTWTASDVAAHPLVTKRLIATGHADVLAAAFSPASGEELVALIEQAVARGPTTQPVPAPAAPAEPEVVEEKPADPTAASARQ